MIKFIFLVAQVTAWWGKGHQVIAQIAHDKL
jgi:hypothetical protein